MNIQPWSFSGVFVARQRRADKLRPAARFALALRRAWLGLCRLMITIWTYRVVLTELDGLSDADLRELNIKPSDISGYAWQEARQRAAAFRAFDAPN